MQKKKKKKKKMVEKQKKKKKKCRIPNKGRFKYMFTQIAQV